MGKAFRRLVPVLVAGGFFSFLDRVNISFAAVALNRDVGLSNTQFGTVAGMFAIGYALFGVPSTLCLQRFGARRWMALTFIGWGLASGATAFASKAWELGVLRFLLGAAEASYAPGVLLVCNAWFPLDYRARVLGALYMIVPVSQFVGGAISAVFLRLDGIAGLKGWQWLFLVEALPSLVMAVVIWWVLVDEPEDARWLSGAEKAWLHRRLQGEVRTNSSGSVGQALRDARVWRLVVVGMGLATGGIGTLTFLPLMVHSMGFADWESTVLAALPGSLAALTLPLWGVWADRTQQHTVVVGTGCAAIAGGLMLGALLLPSAWALVPVSIALAAFFGCLPAFWTLPSLFLAGAGAAAGIAFISVTGNLGQFVGPYVMGWMADRYHSQAAGLGVLAALAAASAVIVGFSRHLRALEEVRVGPGP